MQSAVEVVALLRRSPGDAAVQLEGLQYLADLSHSPEGVQHAVAAAAIEAVVAAMKAHAGEDINVQRSGCVTLSSIATATEGKGGGCGRHRGSFGRYEGMHRRH